MSLFKPSKKHKSWYLQFHDRAGRWRKMRAFRDRRTSKILDEKIQTIAGYITAGAGIPESLLEWIRTRLDERRIRKLVEYGLVPASIQDSPESLDAMIKAFEDHLRSKGRTEKHVKNQVAYVRSICDACGYQMYDKIDGDEVLAHLAERRSDGLSISGSNHYITAIKQFCRWACGAGRRAETNPVSWLQKSNEERDRRRVRRVPSPDEITKLIETTAKQPFRGRMTGEERALLYSVAVSTGLRVSELRQLRVSGLELDADVPVVKCRAAYTKSGKQAVQPIPVALVGRLHTHVEHKQPDDRVFTMPMKSHMIRVFREDLEAAGIPYVDDDGCYFDMHAARHTYITYLDRAGVHPRDVQELARHGSMGMTLRYCQERTLAAKSDAVSKLPAIGVGSDSDSSEAG